MSDSHVGVNQVYHEVKLEKIRYAYQEYFSMSLLDVESWIDKIDGGYLLMVRGHVWGEHLETKTIEYPADWFQAFKQRFFPRWLIKYFPINMNVIRIEADVLYPDFRCAFPKEKHFAIFRTHTKSAQS
jgi:hypothetical protein